ncbi:hypothetical protein JCGZ_17705 [Jatropha curcas]|uniref:MalT-like TPR region domain-containing protein n=1 Tax=Jatropha curcas TaxID=180498 RepID=A0A067JRM9_JATCU|nr:hypothetical protein JCGZ_17705 [Jatropha curcas]
MEASLDEKELGLASLKIGLKLDQEGEDPEKTLSFASRALKVLESEPALLVAIALQLMILDKDNSKPSLLAAMALQFMGSASYMLKKFNDSLGYLNKANRVLVRLVLDGNIDVEDIKPMLHAVQHELSNVKTAMGRREEAIENLKMSLEIKEMTLDKDNNDLAVAHRELAEAYVAVLNFKEALPFGLKALEIHRSSVWKYYVEVAYDRRLLGVIYSGLEEHEKALEQNQLSQKVLKKLGLSSDLLREEIDTSNMHLALHKYDEAIDTLKGVVQHAEKDSETRALVFFNMFISMTEDLHIKEKYTDSKWCLDIACGILANNETVSLVKAVEAYSELAMQYSFRVESERAVSLLKRMLPMLENLPQQQHFEGSVSAEMGFLLLCHRKLPEAITYLESAAEKFKQCFGSEHFAVGCMYDNLGVAYFDLDRPQSAVERFAAAKDILDVALGPHHKDSIQTCQNLSKAYGAMGSYSLAIEFQERVIDAWESHEPSPDAEYELVRARRCLEQLKAKTGGASIEQEESWNTTCYPLTLPDFPLKPELNKHVV